MTQEKNPLPKNSNEEFQEISEKPTSGVGNILLIIMGIFIIIASQKIFSDLKGIPNLPVSPSYCIQQVNNLIPEPIVGEQTSPNLTAYGAILMPSRQRYPMQGNCNDFFNETDKKFRLDEKYNAVKDQVAEINDINNTLGELENQNYRNSDEISRLKNEYDLGLQEKIARENAGIIDKDSIKRQIQDLENATASNQEEIAKLQAQKDKIIQDSSAQIKDIQNAYKEAIDYYQTQQAYYNFKLFFLQFLYVLPLFGLSVFFYLRLKRKNSQYTVILTALTITSAILFAQIALVFLYDILPKEWLARVFQFFMSVPFLRYIIYYGSILLIIILFGGIVYYIQKKVFSPEKVAMRRLKNKRCPSCDSNLNEAPNFCSNCGEQVKEKCQSCGNMRTRYMKYCPFCGK